MRIAALACLSTLSFGVSGAAHATNAESTPPLSDILARYAMASRDPGLPDFPQVQISGTLSGAGLKGTFHTWRVGDRERDEANLGPRRQRTLRLGARIWYGDADGAVHEYTGVLGRRSRTDRFIDSGDFAKAPERCELRGPVVVNGKLTYAVDVTADGGEPETLYLDALTGLPDRIAYDDDDGRATVDLSDWRNVAGRRLPFVSVSSNGDRAFDTVQTTLLVDSSSAIDPAVFAPLVPRYVEMTEPDTVRLERREGHIFVPVRIGGRHFTFLFDSGAQNVVLDSHVAAELGLSSVGALEASGASRTGGLRLVTLDSIEIGSGRLRNIVASTLDLKVATGGAFHIDGILGSPFLAAAMVRLDLARDTMTFGVPGSLPALGEKLPLVLDRGLPEVTLRLNETIDGVFLIDTGSAAEILLYKPFVDKHSGVVPFSENNRRSFGIGGATESYRSSLDALAFGSIPIYHADADVMRATSGAFADRFEAGNVGLGVLKNFIVTFDEANATMFLQKGDDFDDGRRRV